jgi:hypothetical protein
MPKNIGWLRPTHCFGDMATAQQKSPRQGGHEGKHGKPKELKGRD